MAATRQIAMSAQESDLAKEPEIKINVNPEPLKIVPQQFVIFKLVNEKMNKCTLDGICHNVENPTTKKRETMRLLRGAPSIWTSDLTELLKDKDYVNKNREGLQFIGTICRIPLGDVNKIEYARHHISNVKERRNGAGKFDFYEYDAKEESKRKHSATMSRLKMVQTVTLMEENKMIKLALFLGIRPTDDEIGIPKDPEDFRNELVILADKRPDMVERYLTSPEVEIAALIRKGIQENKIDLGSQNGNALWAGSGAFICKIPTGEKVVAYLTQFAMTNSNEGREFQEKLETIVT